jgi:hypothetical protein
MRLESAQALKRQLLEEVVEPFSAHASRPRTTAGAGASAAAVRSDIVFGVGARPFDTLPRIHRSLALGVAQHQGEYWLALRIQRPSLVQSPLVEHVSRQAKGEIDVRIIGRIDKRSKARRAGRTTVPPAAAASAVIPWYQRNTRPLLIGASVGHVDVTAGTIGAFVKRGDATYLLSNNHVLANEDLARAGDRILQRAAFDGGKQPSERVARLRFWIRMKTTGANFVDAALAEIDKGIAFNASRLRGLVNGVDRKLAGLGPAFTDEGETVFKIGRTTGPTAGRVTAFDLDNLVVNYDRGNLRFDNQIEIEGVGTRSFSDGGDSGSLIVNAKIEATALLFAGSDSGGSNGLGLTYASPLQRVLQGLNAKLLF